MFEVVRCLLCVLFVVRLVRCLLCVVCCWFFVVGFSCSWFVVWRVSLFVARCSLFDCLFVVCCLFVCCLLFVSCRLLIVECWLLFVVC